MIGALIFIFIVASVYGFVNLLSMGEAHRFLMKNRPEALRLTPKSKLSWASRQILKEFYALPKDWRPAGVDIISIVKALDVKHGREALDNHFYDYVYGKPGWRTYGGKDRQHCRHSRDDIGYRWDPPCPGFEHVALHREFLGLKESLAKQEARFRNMAIAGDLDALAALKQHVGEYRKIIDDDNHPAPQ